MLLSLGRYVEAREDVDRALAINPNSHMAVLLRGTLSLVLNVSHLPSSTR